MLNLTESMKDYLMAIYSVQGKNGEVRSIDIVRRLEHSRSSVSVAIKRLREKKLVRMDSRKRYSGPGKMDHRVSC